MYRYFSLPSADSDRVANRFARSESRETIRVFAVRCLSGMLTGSANGIRPTDVPQSLAAIDRPHVKSDLDTPRRIRR